MLQYIAISNISIFLSGVLYCIAATDIAIYCNIVASYHMQGSVLGPTLFLLYINDISEGIHSQIRLFADDCFYYRT